MSRILLVEDDTMIASGILYALETEGYETNHATGIKDARSLIEHYNFDLAIIDMQLPDGTGFDVSEIFKNNATSVIFLTVVDDENTIVRAFDEGAIKEYIRNQLQEDIAQDTLNFKEYTDPFTGEPVK